jgi:hypothetical protein
MYVIDGKGESIPTCIYICISKIILTLSNKYEVSDADFALHNVLGVSVMFLYFLQRNEQKLAKMAIFGNNWQKMPKTAKNRQFSLLKVRQKTVNNGKEKVPFIHT